MSDRPTATTPDQPARLGWSAHPGGGEDPPAGRGDGGVTADLRRQLLRECDAMARHAFNIGVKAPAPVAAGLDRMAAEAGSVITVADLVILHNRLAEMVAPALPQTILMLQNDPFRGRWQSIFGPLPTIRRLMTMSLLFTGIFMTTCLSSGINPHSMAGDILTMSGTELLQVLVFILAAAGMGACFQSLFTAQRYVADGTYDERYDSSYWTRIALGLTAGLMLAELIPIQDAGGASPSPLMGKPLLALLGGFSASLVHRVLAKLVDTVESLFTGDPRDRVAALETAARARTTAATSLQRMEMATSLLALQNEVARGGSPDQLAQSVGKVVQSLMPDATGIGGPRDGSATGTG